MDALTRGLGNMKALELTSSSMCTSLPLMEHRNMLRQVVLAKGRTPQCKCGTRDATSVRA